VRFWVHLIVTLIEHIVVLFAQSLLTFMVILTAPALSKTTCGYGEYETDWP
jgi:hypothetical protein